MRNRRWIKRVLILFFLRHLQPRIFWGLTNQGNRQPPRRAAPPVGVRVDRVVRPRIWTQWSSQFVERPLGGSTFGIGQITPTKRVAFARDRSSSFRGRPEKAERDRQPRTRSMRSRKQKARDKRKVIDEKTEFGPIIAPM